MKENKDCPAMPMVLNNEHFQAPSIQYFGLSKREAFAMAALQGLSAHFGCGNIAVGPTCRDIADHATDLADALLQALEDKK